MDVHEVDGAMNGAHTLSGIGCRIWLVSVLMMVTCTGARAAEEIAEISMRVGETQVLTYALVTRVAVGNGQVMSAVALDKREVVIFARQSGISSLHVWGEKGGRKAYRITVMPAETDRIRAEVAALLLHIPHARSMTVGEKIVIEGEELSDADHRRISALVERYPQALDFTSEVGWDRMVMLDVQVIEVPRSRMRELGIRWDGASTGGLHTGLAWDSSAISRMEARPDDSPLQMIGRAAPAQAYFGINALLSARIEALSQSGEAVVLAQPQLMARSGSTAEFLAGGEVPYTTVDSNGRSSTLFKPYGVSLRITPTAQSNGTVRSRIEVEASSVDSAIVSPSGPALKTRRAATEFNVRSGQTLVLAGFISREQTRTQSGVPGLSRLPLLGALFRTRRVERRETELAIFVTPVILGRNDAALAERVRRGKALVDDSFGSDAIELNVPVAVTDAVDSTWNPYRGSGSQWRKGPRVLDSSRGQSHTNRFQFNSEQ
jgi:pilus assembly protein CpaC